MGGDGAGSRTSLQRTPARATRGDCDFCQQLRSGGGDRFLREKVWIAEGDQQSSKLLVLGAARLHRRKCDRARQRWNRGSQTLRQRGSSRTDRPSLFAARRALRGLPLPRIEPALAGTLAEDEKM